MDWDRRYYGYIMASHSRVLYIGTTSDLRRRVYQHEQGLIKGIATKYQVTRLVYYEESPTVVRQQFESASLKVGFVRRKCASSIR